jgi:hypothetical protein
MVRSTILAENSSHETFIDGVPQGLKRVTTQMSYNSGFLSAHQRFSVGVSSLQTAGFSLFNDCHDPGPGWNNRACHDLHL